MKLAHAGFAVEDLEEAIELWQSLGFELIKQFDKDDPAAYAASLKDENGGGIELWQFTGESPLNKIVGRHFAFLCKDVNTESDKLKVAGFSEVIPFTRGVTLDYIFLKDSFGSYYELAQPKN